MLNSGDVIFLLDVDNTLLDNDRFAADLGDRLEQAFGASERERYWTIFARLREQLGLADYLGSLQMFRAGLDDHPELLAMSEFLLDYPFAARLFPRALEAVDHLGGSAVPWYCPTATSFFNRARYSAPGSGMRWMAGS